MRIALSSAAAPAASLAELVESCQRRGLSALHLVAGHGHGISDLCTDAELAHAHQLAQSAGVSVVSFEPGARGADVARISSALGARSVQASAVLDASQSNVDEAAAALFARQPAVDHITLRGGGPEAAQFEGRGIGALMARLALTSYHGVLVLAPSSTAVLPVWRTWLMRGRNWGCGSKTADPSLVQLG
jgi:hypothetical protein